MNYKEALAYIYSFSDYERGGTFARGRKEDLSLETELLRLLGNPQQRYPSTLIAGTKGKGSTAVHIEAVLRAAGLRTGLYTQPDLHTFRERIQVNGELISEDEVVALLPELRAAVEQLQQRPDLGTIVTYHLGTALAFLAFAHRQVEHAVLEVGLGGRLDATNVVHPLVSVITSISYDHMAVLGDTLTQIAGEKAGIIKPHGLVVTSAQAPEALLAIAAIAQQRQARIIRVGAADGDPAQAEVDAGRLPPLSYRYQPLSQTQRGQRFTVWAPDHVYTDLETSLLGLYQLENATVALATLEQLREQGVSWDEAALRQGFATVDWPARMQIVGHNPLVVVDGAHNADSLHKLLHALRTLYQPRRLIVVLSMYKDKDLPRSIQELADVDLLVLTRTRNPRASTIEDLEALCARYAPGVRLLHAEGSQQAMESALALAEPEDLVCSAGSLALAGEVLRWAAAHGRLDETSSPSARTAFISTDH